MKLNRLFILIAALITLSSCGGGSSSSTPNPTTNQAPEALDRPFGVEEDNTLDLMLIATDTDGTIASYQIVTQPSNGTLTGTGASRMYTPNSNFNGNDIIEFTATDNDGAVSRVARYDIIVMPVNDAPEFSSNSTISIAENSISTVVTLIATDADNDTITFSIAAGSDSNSFALNNAELSFNSSPDFETPTDSNTDNIYQVVVSASDGDAITNQTLSVTVINEESRLRAIVTYPPNNSDLGGGVTQTTVTGFVTDIEDSSTTISINSITVNGVSANLSDNQWTAQIPVTDGFNTLTIALIDGSNQITTKTQSVLNNPYLVIPSGMTFNRLTNQYIVLDAFSRAIFAIDASTYEESILLNDLDIDFEGFSGMVLSNSDTVIISLSTSILELNLSTGNSATISSNNDVGVGLNFNSPSDITLDNTNNLLYAINNSFELIEIDVVSGNRRSINAINANAIGIEHIEYDNRNNRLLALTRASPSDLVEIDVSNGQTTTLAINVDTALLNIIDFTLDSSDGNRAFVVIEEGTIGVTLEIDLITGEGISPAQSVFRQTILGGGGFIRYNEITNELIYITALLGLQVRNLNTELIRFIGSTNIGQGQSIEEPSDLILDEQNNRLIISDLARGVIFVDLDNGNRSTLASSGSISLPYSMALGNSNQLFVASLGFDNILQFDLTTGQSSMLFNPTSITNSLSEGIFDITYDGVNNQLYILMRSSTSSSIIGVDIETGNTNTISSDTIGNGVNFNFPASIAIDSNNNRLFVVDLGLQSLLEVNISNGDRNTISSNTIGNGINFDFTTPAVRIIYDEFNNRILFSQRENDILSVDVNTGNRESIKQFNSSDRVFAFVGIALDNLNNRLFASDPVNGVSIVDLSSGEGAIFSR